jgi:hypothetical protein
MTNSQLRGMVIPHLRSQFERGTPVLFTGAGFSLGARNILGNPVPTVAQLKESLWSICFPGRAFDGSTPLQDLYDFALIRQPKALTQILKQSFTVSDDSVPEFYARFFSMPWYRCYTLNIDDLAAATQRKYGLPRGLVEFSALDESALVSGYSSDKMEVIHLNGDLGGIPERVTFSVTQYGERISRHDSYYVRLTAELVSHPFVFVGTSLDESPLWQHIELRRAKGGRSLRELRPRSYLVTPSLNLARQALLAEYNVLWVPMTAEEFDSAVFAEVVDAAATGLQVLSRSAGFNLEDTRISDVDDLAQAADQPSDYLLGQEPIWGDLQYGRAITRENDDQIRDGIRAALAESNYKGVVVVTGTAGSGKSTALRRLALRLSAEGKRVGWIEAERSVSPRVIRHWMRSADARRSLLSTMQTCTDRSWRI